MKEISQQFVIVCESLACNKMYEMPEDFTPAQLEGLKLPCGHPAKCVVRLEAALLPLKHFDLDDDDLDDIGCDGLLP